MERQQAKGRIERPLRSGIDVSLPKMNTWQIVSDGPFCDLKHLGRRVYAAKRPAGMIFGEGLELQTASSPDDKHPSLFRHTFGEQHR